MAHRLVSAGAALRVVPAHWAHCAAVRAVAHASKKSKNVARWFDSWSSSKTKPKIKPDLEGPCPCKSSDRDHVGKSLLP